MRTYANIDHLEYNLDIKRFFNKIVNVNYLTKFRNTMTQRVIKGYSILVDDTFCYFSGDARAIEDYIYYFIKPCKLSYEITDSVYVARFDYKKEKDITTIYYSNRIITQIELYRDIKAIQDLLDNQDRLYEIRQKRNRLSDLREKMINQNKKKECN